MFYLLLRLLYEDYKDNLFSQESYYKCIEKIAELHTNNKYAFWQACGVYFADKSKSPAVA